MKGTLAVTNDPNADRLLNTDPLALLLGMLLDQQVPMEWAFSAPSRLKARLGGSLDATTIAALGPEKVEEIFRDKPALHRFPGSMGKRAYALCQHLVDHYGGRAETLWSDDPTGDELLRRLRDLPGFGEEKSKIFIALLAKRMGVRPAGWEEAAGSFADPTPRSVADIDSPEAFARVREWKQAQKKAGKAKQD
jgi:uncharacterized HhH-GPD family protein